MKQKGVCGQEMHYTILHAQSLKLPNHVEAILAHNIYRRKDSVSYATGSQPIHTVHYLVCT